MERGRRVTLAGISQSALNARDGTDASAPAASKPARKSIGGPARAPARPSTDGSHCSNKAASSSVHAQMQPQAQQQQQQQQQQWSRRSSAHAHSAGSRREPRPLHDRAFQEACAKKVVAFLAQRGYARQVSQRMLAGPPKEEFAFMMDFLQKQLDPNAASIGKHGKMEDEVPLLFKRLRYPFNVSKSSLQAPGSPHTWPHLLAAMAWLVEVLSYDDAAESRRTGTKEQVGSSMHLFEHVSESYYHFLAGDDAKCRQLDEQLKQDFQNRDERTRADVDRLAAETERLQKQIDTLSASESRSTPAQEHLQSVQRALEQSRQSLHETKAWREKEEKRAHDAQHRVKELERELSSIRESSDALRSRIEKQGLDASDVERMQRRRENLNHSIEQASSRKERAEKAAGDAEVDVENKIATLERSVAEYHKLAEKLELVPLGARRARGVQLGITLNTRLSDPASIVGVDINGSVKPALVSLRGEFQRKARESGDEAISLEDEAQKREDTLEERRYAKKKAQKAVSHAESKYKTEKERIDSEVEHLANEAKQLELSVEDARKGEQNCAQEGAKRLERVQQQKRELKEQLDNELSEKQQWLLAILDRAMVYKQRIQQQLQAAHDAATRAHAEIADQDASSSP